MSQRARVYLNSPEAKLTVNILFRYLASADPGFELLIALR